METAYYVTHPLLDKTAVVYAPSTEKARTTFLDWLERNNLIKRSDRQAFRRDMGTDRLEDPNVPADIELHYGYRDYPSPMRYSMPMHEESITPQSRGSMSEADIDRLVKEIREEEDQEVEPEPIEEGRYREAAPEDVDLRDIGEFRKARPPKRQGMPIQQVMLRGYVE